MTDETTAYPVVMAGDLITGPGLYEARCGHIVSITGWRDGWWVAEWNGIRTEYSSDGRQRFDKGQEPNQWQLLHWVAPLLENMPERVTTTEQLAEIEGQAESTPPDGWRVLAVGEVLQAGDMWVWPTDDQLRQTVHVGAVVGAKQRYIRRIEPQPEPPPVPEPNAAAIEELRSEVSYVQRLLGESRQRVTQLEELVASLRTINRGCENAVREAGNMNTALRNQLAAVKAELASVAADRQQLRVELDAAQQVPADSPELRQLRADLAEVTRERDQYLDSYQRIFGDLETIRETTKAAVVEAIAEWLQPIRAVDNEHLANETLQHLPQIMRHLTGLDSHAID